jgi:hypothetical protein
MNRRTFVRASVGAVAMSALDADRPLGSLPSKSGATSDPISPSETMNPDRVNRIMRDYGAVWNEPDPTERRRRIRSVWTEDGVTCHKLLLRGYQEIEQRVTSSWERWLRDGKYAFKPSKTTYHHDVVRNDFSLVSIPDGKVEARGLSFLILDGNDRIHSDLQFDPTVNGASEFTDRYLAVFNEGDADIQRKRLIELWAPDATYVGEQSVKYGHTDILTSIRELHHADASSELVMAAGKASDAHHNFVTFRWQIENRRSGAVAGAGSELVILDESGRIRIDYQFIERT